MTVIEHMPGPPPPPTPGVQNIGAAREKVPERARLMLRYAEAGAMQEWSGRGLALIEGPWVHFMPDDEDLSDGWQTWPSQSVLCIVWEREVVRNRTAASGGDGA